MMMLLRLVYGLSVQDHAELLRCGMEVHIFRLFYIALEKLDKWSDTDFGKMCCWGPELFNKSNSKK